MALKGPKAVRKDSIDSKSNAHLHKQQKPKRIFSLWIMLVFDTSHSEEDCYWQDIIRKEREGKRERERERVSAGNGRTGLHLSACTPRDPY